MREFGKCIVILMLLSCSCGQNPSVNGVLRRAERVMTERPDSALRLIRSIERHNIRREATLARYALRYSQALDKNYIDMTQDSLARIAADYYARHGSTLLKTQSLYYLGRVYENAGDEDRAIDLFVQAEVLSRGIERRDPYLRALVCQRLAKRYYLQNGFDAALDYYGKSEEAYVTAGIYSNAGYCCQEQSTIYYLVADYQNAALCARRAIGCFEKCDSTSIPSLQLWVQVMEMLGDETMSDRTKQELLQKYASADSSQSDLYDGWLAYFYGKNHHLDSTRYFVESVQRSTEEWPESQAWAFFELSKVEKAAANYEKSLNYLEKGVTIRNSLDSVRRISAVQTVERRLRAGKLQHDFETLQSRQQYQAIIGGLVFLLSVVLGWLLVRATRLWRRRFLEQQRNHVRSRSEMTKQLTATFDELKDRYDLLLNKVNVVAADPREIRFREALEKRFIGLRDLVDNAYVYKVKPAAFVAAFTAFATVSPSAKKEAWADLQYVVNKKFGGLVDYLRLQCPALSTHDLDLCCMICFEFSPVGICFIYGYEDMGSLYNKRSRLRQKLHLTGEQKLEEYLLSLCRDLQAAELAREEKTETQNPIPAA